MELKIAYEVKGKQRRELVQAISHVLNITSVYKGVPTFVESQRAVHLWLWGQSPENSETILTI